MILAPPRDILAPRRPRLWRPPTEWFAHLLRNGSTGHLMRKSATGHLRLKGDPCTFCAATFPASWTATVSGVTLCTCQTSGVIWQTATGSVNGTYTLTKPGASACSRSYVVTSSPPAVLQGYVNSACTVAIGSPTTSFSVGITITSGTITAEIFLSGSSGIGDVFFGTAALTGCGDSYTINNSLGACGSGSHGPGTGGSITLTPV